MPEPVSEESAERNPAMFSGAIRQFPVAMVAVALVAASPISPCRTAFADPAQDQKFFDLLGQKEIPPVDNANSLITSARHACEKLDSGMPVGDLVELVRNNGFAENPLTRLQPQDRITRTIDQFISAAVEAYCPYNKGKIASIAGYRLAPPRIELVSLAVPTGEIAPTKPLPVPAQPPPIPQEVEPAPQQPPTPQPRRVQPAPPQHVEAPAPEAPAPGSEVPAAPAPGGGADGGTAPASPTPDQPAPPGHIRLAP